MIFKNLQSNACILLISLLLILSACNSIEDASIPIIPKPAELTVGQGEFVVTEETILFFDAASSELAEVIQEYLNSITNFSLKVSPEKTENAFLFLISDLPPDEYQLKVTEQKVELAGGSKQALLNGFQSLRQILLMRDKKPSLFYKSKIDLSLSGVDCCWIALGILWKKIL